MDDGPGEPPAAPPPPIDDDGGKGWTSWLPWLLLGILGAIIIGALLFNQGDDEAIETTTTAADTTTTTVEETTTTVEETTTTVVALDPIPLRLGTVLPQTGGLAVIIDALEQPIRMGVDEINGISAGLIAVDFADSGTDPNVASATVDQFLTGSHQGIIGAAASGVSLSIVDKVQSSEVLMCSGSNTAAALSSSDYDPYYHRTAPSDNLQGPILANVIVDDGFTSVAVVWRSDEYGEGFGVLLADTLEGAGVTVPVREGYDHTQSSLADIAGSIAASGAEAVAIITFEEGGQLLLDLEGAGYAGQIYVADGFKDTVGSDQLGGRVDLLEGVKGTAPASSPANGEATFAERLEAFAPGTPTIFSAHKYDCLIIIVLAAQEAQSNDASVIKDHMISVTEGGEKCSLVADCLALVWAGVDIDYDGASGPLDFGPSGEPAIGTYDIFIYDAEGATENLSQVVAGN
jgi:branched-chain amino acid transport system substrate-binding protein